MSVKFFLLLISFLFVLIQIVFLLPWVINIAELGTVGLIKAFIFVIFLFVGFLYMYKKKVFLWD